MRPDPVLIGPVGAGKTTVARRLAEALGVPHVEYDQVRRGYFEELGFDMALNLALLEREGWATMYRYWKVFSPYAVERTLAEHRGVLDLGGGSVVCEHDGVLERLQAAFDPFPNVVLLQPYPDVEASLALLGTRPDTSELLQRNNRAFLEHPSYRQLAKIVVYTEERAPEAIADEVLGRLIRVPAVGRAALD